MNERLNDCEQLVNSRTAANNPSDVEPQYKGETRVGHGYEYWTTSEEDEESLTITERLDAQAENPQPVKKPRKKLMKPGFVKRTFLRLGGLLFVLIVLSGAYFAFNYFKVTGQSEVDTTAPADAIIVLGAAQYNGSPSQVLQERLDHAYNLYKDDTAPLIFTTGAGAPGDITTEGLVGLEHLLEQGMPESDIVLIPEGSNTWEQLSASAFQIEQLDLDTVVLVSDRYHTYRLQQIADELGIDALVSPSAIEPSIRDNLREAAAVSLGRITGYRRLSNFTD